MDLKFNNIQELYELLLPALETKEIQLRRNDYLGLSKKDIFNYLKNNKWKDEDIRSLKLHQLVNDILELDNDELNSSKEL